MIAFKLPSLGSDMDQGKLLEWKVKPGDCVKRGDVVAIVDTSKAAVDVEIWSDGTVNELLVQPGETVPVGTVLATLFVPGETAETAVPVAPGPVTAAKPAAVPVATPATPAAAANTGAVQRRRISPAARRHAEELGVDLDAVRGTGPDSAVTLEDVELAAKAKAAPPDRALEMRRAIAAAMSRSKREIPHYYLADTIPLERATAWLAAENTERTVTERLLMAVLYLKAVALACVKYPEMNGFYRDGGFMPSAGVHVGVAISLRKGGLVAPAIHDVDRKTLAELMRDLSDLVQRARAGSLRSSEMTDPTITLTNLGDGGVESVFGVIYPPQVALVGFGRVVERAWADHGALKAMPAVTASLAADHRVSDGHRGALFMSAIRDLLQQPQQL
jgi:pyruvate dehydrogenase E2 component (dihydrolipoamide acetyltransferase)